MDIYKLTFLFSCAIFLHNCLFSFLNDLTASSELSGCGWITCMCGYLCPLGWCVGFVCIDPRPGWEPCFVPAWLINGVVMAVGRNEGTERRRSASQDPCSWPGTHTLSNTNTSSRCTRYTFLTVVLVAQIKLSVYFACILIPSLLLNSISPLCSCCRIEYLCLFSHLCYNPFTFNLCLLLILTPLYRWSPFFSSSHYLHLLFSQCPPSPTFSIFTVLSSPPSPGSSRCYTTALGTAAEVKPCACSVCVHACIIILGCYIFFVCASNISVSVCVWMCECDVLIHPIDQSRTPDSHHPWEPSGRCLTLPHPNTSWHPINLQPPCIHTYIHTNTYIHVCVSV